MTTYKIVTEQEVLDVQILGEGRDPSRPKVFFFQILVRKDGNEIGGFVISVTDMAIVWPEFEDRKRDATLLNLVRRRLWYRDYSGKIEVTTQTDRESLKAEVPLSEEEQRLRIAKVVYRYLYSTMASEIDARIIIDSTGYPQETVLRAFWYLARRDAVAQADKSTPLTFPVGREIYDVLEDIMRKGISRIIPAVGYFREIPLPREFDSEYAFVLMPFGKDAYPSKEDFDRLIRPAIMDATGLNCWRADDSQDQLLITDQIYTMILRARAVVAEITRLNANVLIEIGVALAFNKRVWLFYNESMLEKVPFYLRQIPYHPYRSDAEFREKLMRVRLS